MKIVIAADKFFFEDEIKEKGYLVIENGKFKEYHKELPNGDYEFVDYSGNWIAPGLIDTHIHGLNGSDIMDNDEDTLSTISNGLLSCGVTSFFPTTLTDSIERLNSVVENITKNYNNVAGAKVRGIFLEGPFFSKEYKGAQNEKYFEIPSVESLEKWKELSKDLKLKIALAPELNNANEFIEQAINNGVCIALAHSNATYEEATNAINKGASMFVHTFNGMTPLHHRDPGMVGAAMLNKNTYKEIICDGYHVHPQAVNLLIQVAGKDKVVLVSDCIKAGLMPEGNYTLGEFDVVMKDNTARLLDGTLAGSTIKLIDAVRNIVNWNVATLHDAINMASINAAKSVNIDDVCGKIESGYQADFIVINNKIELQATYIAGKLKYNI